MTKKLRAAALIGLSATMLLISASLAAAAPGELDPTFGSGGFSSPAAPPDYGYSAYAVGEQSDGKLLTIASESYLFGPARIVVQRALPNGAPDDTYGTGGIARFTPPSGTWSPFAAAIGPDGSIAVTGYFYNGSVYVVFVVKFTAAGEVDAAFDGDASNSCAGNGLVCTAINVTTGQDQGRAIAFQSDGKIVVAGASQHSSGYTRMGVVRYNTDGDVDPTFGGEGKFQIQVGPWSSYANGIVIQPDGAIVIAGVTQGKGPNWNGADTYTDAIGLARLSSEGDLDTSFHSVPADYTGPPFTDGVMFSPRAQWTYGAAYAVAAAQGGSVIVSGYANDVSPSPTRSSALVARVLPSGALDPSFGSGGRALIDIGPHQDGRSVRVDAAGRPLVAGYTDVSGTQDTLAMRLTTAGALDPAFNGTGFRVFTGNSVGGNPGSLIASDGKWVLSGGAAGARWAMLRMLMADAPVVPPPPPTPSVTITSPSKKSLKRSKLRQLAGTAGPTGSIAKVEIALQRKDSKLLKKKKRCAWLSSSKAKFKSVKASKSKCSKPYYRAASGTSNWKYRITRTLPTGSYVLTARVTLLDGKTATKTFSFKLKK